ncbi:hypothetical protein LJC32_02165 [Oscillospiraceae bacterium OttesenSCG-928-F05]|nr:hypothetical protein [Oscillospiraceae bacterium OttesenSCG-928-F05]
MSNQYGEIDFVGMMKEREARIAELRRSMDEELATIRVKYAVLLAEYEPEKEEYERRQREFEQKWRLKTHHYDREVAAVVRKYKRLAKNAE